MKGKKKNSKIVAVKSFKEEERNFLSVGALDCQCDEQFSDAYSDGYKDGFYYGQIEGERSIFDRIINPYASACLSAAVSILQENGVCNGTDAFKVLEKNNSIIIEETRKFLESKVEPLLH